MVYDFGVMYKSVAQKVMLYFRNSWVVTGAKVKILEGFLHWTTRQIAGMTDKRVADGGWEYPPVVSKLETAGLYPIQE